MMEIKVFKSVTDVEEKDWNAIVGEDQIICSHQYLKAIERSNINDCDYFYLVAYLNNEIVAHTCTYSIGFDLAIFAQGISKKIIDSIRNVFPGFLILKLFECGTPVALGNTYSFRDDIDRKEVIIKFAAKMEEIAETQQCGLILLRDFVDEELKLFGCLEDAGYSKVENLPDTMLPIYWESFEDYLKSFKALYRREFTKRIDMLSCEEISVQVTGEFAEYAEDFVRLWQNVYDKATEYRREILTVEYFRNMDICLGNRSKAVLIKKDDAVIGFGLFLIDDKTLRPLYLGIDYELNEKYKIYFNIYYQAVKLGIDEKLDNVEYGITTYHNKLDLGAHLVPLYMYMKHRNRILSPVFAKAFKLMTPKIEIAEKIHHFNEEARKRMGR